MPYHQITFEERYAIQRLLRQRIPIARIAEIVGRHRSTIYREVQRNAERSGCYRDFTADRYARQRLSRSRRNRRFTKRDWNLVEKLLCGDQWSPEQIAGRLKLQGRLSISHESIYRHVWADASDGGSLWRHLRQAAKQRRKRHNTYDSRGRLAGKRAIETRPAGAENRSRVGHWEIDTVSGSTRQCIVTLVERKTGYVEIGKLEDRTVASYNRRTIQLIQRQPRAVRTITADNGTENHGFRQIEKATGTRVYFANPHHSWERGTSENTNGLIRQYLPKRTSMDDISQYECNAIARKLNRRPRKRHGYLTPEECYLSQTVALQS